MDEMTLREVLRNEIKTRLEEMADLDPASDEYKARSEAVTKLSDRLAEAEKVDLQFTQQLEEKEIRDREHELQQQKLAEEARYHDAELAHKAAELTMEKLDRAAKIGVSVVTFVGGVALTVWGTLKSLKFEETGTVSTAAGRSFIGRLFSKK